MGIFKRKSGTTPKLPVDQAVEPLALEVVSTCICASGHSLLSDKATFSDYPGITLKLRNDRQEGFLSLSPVIGDKDRTFFDTEWNQDEIVEICCPTCSEPLPVYNECFCGVDLVAMFTTTKSDFANCIGICQRIGCTHAEIISNYNLRVNTRREASGKGTDIYGRS